MSIYILPIAQVLTAQSNRPWYIPHARNHHGFVVQRRYRGIGEPYYAADTLYARSRIWESHGKLESYLAPFLNLAAVRAAGVSAVSIQRWSQTHPGKIYTHPTYAGLCLRWGENTHGMVVQELEKPMYTADAVPFTPHTCWKSGVTYYQLALSNKSVNAEPELLKHLYDRAGLLIHEQQLGQEGNWPGWYALDRPNLERALATVGRRLVLDQFQVQHHVWVKDITGGDQGTIYHELASYDSADEARAHFDVLPLAPLADQYYPAAAFGHVVQWPGREREECEAYDKPFDANASNWIVEMPMRLMTVQHNARLWVSSNDLAECESPTSRLVPTLINTLSKFLHPRWSLSAKLGWTPEGLEQREQHPELLTLAEIARIAQLTNQSEERFLADLRWEIRARASLEARDKASKIPGPIPPWMSAKAGHKAPKSEGETLVEA